jgi:hypothetical protein
MGHPGINEVEHDCPPGRLVLAGSFLGPQRGGMWGSAQAGWEIGQRSHNMMGAEARPN